jgi:hypothetical protein
MSDLQNRLPLQLYTAFVLVKVVLVSGLGATRRGQGEA